MPSYDYICSACNKNWDEMHSITDRKIPESRPCPKCGSENTVEQSIVISPLSIGDPVRMGHIKPPKAFQDRLQQIHNKTPGSRMDKTSTITPIKSKT